MPAGADPNERSVCDFFAPAADSHGRPAAAPRRSRSVLEFFRRGDRADRREARGERRDARREHRAQRAGERRERQAPSGAGTARSTARPAAAAAARSMFAGAVPSTDAVAGVRVGVSAAEQDAPLVMLGQQTRADRELLARQHATALSSDSEDDTAAASGADRRGLERARPALSAAAAAPAARLSLSVMQPRQLRIGAAGTLVRGAGQQRLSFAAGVRAVAAPAQIRADASVQTAARVAPVVLAKQTSSDASAPNASFDAAAVAAASPPRGRARGNIASAERATAVPVKTEPNAAGMRELDSLLAKYCRRIREPLPRDSPFYAHGGDAEQERVLAPAIDR